MSQNKFKHNKNHHHLSNLKIAFKKKEKEKIPPADSCEAKIDVVVDGLRFWSTFDSGNLARVTSIFDGTYCLWIARDCGGRFPGLLNNSNLRQWFYFKVENPLTEPRYINFQIENLEPLQFSKIWKQDPEIYVKVHNKGNSIGKEKWIRLKLSNLFINSKAKTMQAQWQFIIPSNRIVSFAFCCPWSYTHNQQYITKMQGQFQQDKDIEFSRELLCYSYEGRNIELITLTSRNRQLNKKENEFGDNKILFPDKKNDRPYHHDKPYLFITCRVHAGEQPASYMMKGMLEFLSQYKSNPDAKAFLDNFVLILIPMLNPDGVYRGHYRLDALGYDLNRVYNRMNKKIKFPAQYAVIETAKYYDQRVKAYIDLHSHSEISNSFVFTNKNSDTKNLITTLLFPYLMSFYLEHFSVNRNTLMGEKQQLKMEELEGQLTEQEGIEIQSQYLNTLDQETDNHFWHKTKYQLMQSRLSINLNEDEESKFSDQQEQINSQINLSDPLQKMLAFKYIPGFRGIAKSDVFFATSIEHVYTLETNYKYYYVREGDQIVKKKFGPKEFESIGQCCLLSFLEIDQLRNDRSVLKSKGYNNINQLRNEIQGQIEI